MQLYIDDGDGAIDADDLFAGATGTDGAGFYSFSGLGNATYWVVVDSRTLGAGSYDTGGLNDVWAEQTYATSAGSSTTVPSTAIAAEGRSTATWKQAGPRVRTTRRRFSTAEHVTRVALAGVNVAGVDSGFSFSVVTTRPRRR